MRTFLVKPGSREIIEFICNRDNIAYRMLYDKDKDLYFMSADITRSRFKEILKDVKCEIASKKSLFPVYSAQTFGNPTKLRKLMRLNGTNKFTILPEDRWQMDC